MVSRVAISLLRHDVAYYTLAYKPFEVLLALISLATLSLLPYIITNDRYYTHVRKLPVLISTIGLAIMGCVFIGAPVYVALVGGADLYPAVAALRILAVALVPSMLIGYYSQIMLAHNKDKILMKISFVGLVVNILINLFVIPLFGYIGASWTTVFTQSLVCILLLVVVGKRTLTHVTPHAITSH